MKSRRLIALLATWVLGALLPLAVFGAPAVAQRHFATAQAAGVALHEAVRSGDRAAMTRVLGPGSAELVDSGDPAEDQLARERFVAAYEKSARIETRAAHRAELVIGAEEWRVPFPLVREVKGWRFDTKAGRAEVIARRIGRNELAAIHAALAYVDAQREYALERHDGAGPGMYAQRIASAQGRHDGLYWAPTREGALSPLGVMFRLAAADETAAGDAHPYNGYFFRVLHAQGTRAPGGAMDYVVNGRMIGGFALVAYPARYRVSGVRTFLVGHEGVVYSRDLGVRTTEIARAMKRFDPDRPWARENVAVASVEDGERMRHLAGELGCTICHREAPSTQGSDGAVPLAPSWRDIAARYRGKAGAEETLTHIVIDGADPLDRHWKNRAGFTTMRGNEVNLTSDEARALVRWILTSP